MYNHFVSNYIPRNYITHVSVLWILKVAVISCFLFVFVFAYVFSLNKWGICFYLLIKASRPHVLWHCSMTKYLDLICLPICLWARGSKFIFCELSWPCVTQSYHSGMSLCQVPNFHKEVTAVPLVTDFAQLTETIKLYIVTDKIKLWIPATCQEK